MKQAAGNSVRRFARTVDRFEDETSPIRLITGLLFSITFGVLLFALPACKAPTAHTAVDTVDAATCIINEALLGAPLSDIVHVCGVTVEEVITDLTHTADAAVGASPAGVEASRARTEIMRQAWCVELKDAGHVLGDAGRD